MNVRSSSEAAREAVLVLRRIRDIQPRHFDLLARQLGLARNAYALMADIHAATPKVITEVQRGLPRGFPAQVLDPILEGLSNSTQRLEPPG
jgi:serine/threonine-protein kinase HipA